MNASLALRKIINIHPSDKLIFEVLEEILARIEDPRSIKIYSSRNGGVKKGSGPQGTRDEEFLVPSLLQIDFIANSSQYPIPRIFCRFALSGGDKKKKKKVLVNPTEFFH